MQPPNQLHWQDFDQQIQEYALPRLRAARSSAEVAQTVAEVRTLAVAHATELERDRPRFKADCARGCTSCCHIRVDASPPEVIALMHWLYQRLAPRDLDALIDRVSRVDRQTRGLAEPERAALGIACPLLIDDLCSAYEVRPFDCQGYVSSDVGACRAALDNYDLEKIPNNRLLYRAVETARYALTAAANQLGFKGQTLELTAALYLALTNENVAQRWLSGEDLFADAAITEY